jgi:hypothetical protein
MSSYALCNTELHIENTGIHNHSQKILTENEIYVLALGLNFIPTPSNVTDHIVLSAFDKFARSIRLRYQFIDNSEECSNLSSILRVPNPSFQPDKANACIEKYLNTVLNRIKTALRVAPFSYSGARCNFTNTITLLKEDKSIIIKPCDKNLGTCVVSREWYEKEALSQLSDDNTYERIMEPPLAEAIFSNLIAILHQYKYYYSSGRNPNEMSAIAKALLQLQHNPLKLARFYLLIKVHKPILAGRPICSSIGCPTYFASKYLDHVLQPLARKAASYIADSSSLVRIIENTTFPEDCIFATADVTSLYPSITTDAGLRALDIALTWNKTEDNFKHFILDLTRWVLTNNYLEFGDKVYHQKRGTAMGTPVAVAYANIFLAVFEYEVFKKCSTADPTFISPLLYRRFIDDLIAIFTRQIDCDRFLALFNLHDPTIKITSESSRVSAVCLDVELYKGPRFAACNKLDVRLYQKPQNKYLYLPPHSFHNKAIFPAFIRSEIARYRLRCSADADFQSVTTAFFQRLLDRGYTASFLTPLFSNPPLRIDLLTRSSMASSSNHNKKIPLIFKVPYTNRTQQLHLANCLRFTDDLLSDPASRQVFGTRRPILCYSSEKKLASFLTSSRHPFPVMVPDT